MLLDDGPDKIYLHTLGPEWWSSGQHARPQIWRSEFEFGWSLQFPDQRYKNTYINEKEVEVCIIFSYAVLIY